MFRSLLFVALTIPAVCASVSNLTCDLTECDASNPTAAYTICEPAVNYGIFPTAIIGTGMPFPTNQDFLDFCMGLCDDGSRQTLYGGASSGAVFDICSGCAADVVQNICAICSGRVGVGVCDPSPPTPRCTLSQGDPTGDATSGEEVIGQTTTALECAALVAQHRPTAGGMAWSMNDADGNGRGNCYAEFGPTTLSNVGVAPYMSCIFGADGADGATTNVFNAQGASTSVPEAAQGSGFGSGADRNNVNGAEDGAEAGAEAGARANGAGMSMGMGGGMGMGMGGGKGKSIKQAGKGKANKSSLVLSKKNFQSSSSSALGVVTMVVGAVCVIAGFGAWRAYSRFSKKSMTADAAEETTSLLADRITNRI